MSNQECRDVLGELLAMCEKVQDIPGISDKTLKMLDLIETQVVFERKRLRKELRGEG